MTIDPSIELYAIKRVDIYKTGSLIGKLGKYTFNQRGHPDIRKMKIITK